jgi:hypothetical protein
VIGGALVFGGIATVGGAAAVASEAVSLYFTAMAGAATSTVGLAGASAVNVPLLNNMFTSAGTMEQFYEIGYLAAESNIPVNIGFTQNLSALSTETNLLMLTAPNWNPARNAAFIQGVIDAGGTFVLRTPISQIIQNILSSQAAGVQSRITVLELIQIVSQGHQYFGH